MRVAVTGSAGFIGSNLVDALLATGHTVTGLDNLSTGDMRFLEGAQQHQSFSFHRMDLVHDAATLTELIEGHDAVVHLAANADVRFGWEHPGRDLEQNVVATHHVLEAIRQ